jgi:hypothetical protein
MPRAACETCDIKFDTQAKANLHMDNLGHWKPKFACEACDCVFSTQWLADQHMNTLGHWRSKYPCPVSGRIFSTQHDADNHMHANNHCIYHCEECDIHFATAAAMLLVSVPTVELESLYLMF